VAKRRLNNEGIFLSDKNIPAGQECWQITMGMVLTNQLNRTETESDRASKSLYLLELLQTVRRVLDAGKK